MTDGDVPKARVAIASVQAGDLAVGAAVELAGRVTAIAATALGVGIGKARRVRLRDASGEVELELDAGVAMPGEGALVRVAGSVAAAADGRTRVVRASRIEVVGTPSLAAGAQPEWAAPSWANRRAELHARDALLRALRGWFRDQDFLEVETPTLLAAPGQEPHLLPFATAFHGRGGRSPRWLATSPEYAMKRLLSVGFERIFQLGKSYRDGRDEQSPLHSPEFTLLEWYRAWEPLRAIGDDVEQLLRTAAIAVGRDASRIERAGRVCDLAARATWLPVEAAFRDHADVDLARYLDGDDAGFVAELPADVPRVGDSPRAQADSAYFRLLVERIEPRLGVGRPTFLCRYPARHAALAELCADDPRVAERFEAYVLGVELANAFQELRDPIEQERRLRAENDERVRGGGPPLPISEPFLRALRAGLPPSSGIALGVDRLHLLVTGAASVADVQPFPFEPPPD